MNQTNWAWQKVVKKYSGQEETLCGYCVAEMLRLSKEAALWERLGYYPSDLVLIDREGCQPCVQPRGK